MNKKFVMDTIKISHRVDLINDVRLKIIYGLLILLFILILFYTEGIKKFGLLTFERTS